MRRLFAVLLVQLATFVTAPAQTPSQAVSSIGPGEVNVVIRNASPSTRLTAYVVIMIQMLPPNSSGHVYRVAHHRYRDASIDQTIAPIAPNQEAAIQLGAKNGTTPSVALPAGVYEDGTTFGDPEWVAMILKRRANFAAVVNEALEEINMAVSQGLSGGTLIQQFNSSWKTKMAASQQVYSTSILETEAAGFKNPLDQLFQEQGDQLKKLNLKTVEEQDRRDCIQQVYLVITKNLSRAASQPNGSPQPPSSILDGVALMLKKQRDAVVSAKPPLQ